VERGGTRQTITTEEEKVKEVKKGRKASPNDHSGEEKSNGES